MNITTNVLLVALLTVSAATAQSPWGNWVPQQSRPTGADMSDQQRAGSATNQRNSSKSKSWFNSGFTQTADVDVGLSGGKQKERGKKSGRDRDEKWFAGVRGGARAGYAADTGVAQHGRIGRTQTRSYADAEAFVGVEAGAQAGVSNNGVGVNGNAFAGARVRGRVGQEVGPVGVAATGEAWSGVGVEAGADAKYKNGRIKFDYGVGGAIGVGGKAGGEVSLDVRKTHKTVNRVGSTGRRVSRDVGKSAQTVKNSASRSVKKKGKKAKRSIGKLFK